MSDNLRTLGGGGGSRRFPFSSPSSGLPQPKNDPLWLEPCSFLLRLCDIPPDGPPADWPSYDTLPAFTRSSNKQIRSDESLREVYERFLFFLDHCDRRTDLLAFIRCSKKNCPCAKKPWRAKRFRAELDHLKGLPTPIPHPAHADHFLSYAEHREQRLNADPDTHQPSFAKCPGRCTLCRYVFKSENDKAVHNRLRHPRSGSLLNE